ncbi:MAG: hypothetical protein P4L96_09485 [Rhodoferax sp.]|nr:hypothetical protein [Rhodoferax sp.]
MRIMASRLDPFLQVLFDQLNGQGQSYRTVAANLLLMGVEISPQSLRSWHVRKMRKISHRSASPAPLVATRSSAPSIPTRQVSAAASPPKTAPVCPTDGNLVHRSLRAQIAEEEKLLAARPFFQTSSVFPVPRKR